VNAEVGKVKRMAYSTWGRRWECGRKTPWRQKHPYFRQPVTGYRFL